MYRFNVKITQWYKKNFRSLPWRETRDPYLIWISEIILQQTRIEQGLPYFEKFASKFPTVKDLAMAKEEDVLKLWQGLGYYSRARNMHHAARQIVEDFGGKFPDTYAQILKLKGVGSYTAAAIATIAFDLKEVAVDGNVYRFATRYFGVRTPINTPKCEKEIIALLKEQLPETGTGDFTQAAIEIGALICKPKNPLCVSCPVADTCYALRNNEIEQLPVKLKKLKRKTRYFNYFIFNDKGHYHIRRRTEKDIWQGLYEFPLLEKDETVSKKQLSEELEKRFGISNLSPEDITEVFDTKHVLTHQDIYARFWKINAKCPIIVNQNTLIIKKEEIDRYPVSRLVELFLETPH